MRDMYIVSYDNGEFMVTHSNGGRGPAARVLCDTLAKVEALVSEVFAPKEPQPEGERTP